MKLENYYFTDRRLNPAVVYAYRLAGNVFGREGVEDGSMLYTSYIASHDDKTATTESGSVYELGQIHPDYTDMLKKIESGIPIITQCSIITNEIFPDGTTGLHVDGEIMSVKDGDYIHSDQGHWFEGKVIGQKENLLTIRCYNIDGKLEKCRDITAYIVWPEYFSDETEKCFILEGLNKDQYDPDLEETFSLKCRPRLKI